MDADMVLLGDTCPFVLTAVGGRVVYRADA
jgi:hypothetical protein